MNVDFEAILGILFICNSFLLVFLLQLKTYWYYKVVQFRKGEMILDWFNFLFLASFRKIIFSFDILEKDENDTPAIERLRSRHNWMYAFIVGNFIGTLVLCSIRF